MQEANSLKVGFLLLVLFSLAPNCKSVEFCPSECHCHHDHDSNDFYVDCSGLGLTELPHFPDTNVQILDLSENLFTFIPPDLSQFSNLRYLDMSSNLISSLPPQSLEGLKSLKQLNLSKNNISNWANLYPNEFLTNTPFLEELSLAENQFTSFSSNDISLVLFSPSVRYLDLSNCKITKISGKEVILGLSSLETLKLNGNPIHGISDIKSDSLKTLDLSNCRLGTLQPTALSGLTSLAYVNLARNYKLSLSMHGNVTSSSLRRINLSLCNMDSIDLGGFPNLKTVILRGNMIRQLTRESFAANPLLENIDLSSNSINLVQNDAFRLLMHMKTLDLSFNSIPRIDGRTFKDNEMLTQINLSRNYIARLQRIVASSLAHLNMSWCEILSIDADALGAMPSLIDLDLSHNLLYEDPSNIASETLQTLDLSMCRITSIRNTTFSRLPALMKINLAGNRFTTPFRVEYFENNPYLSEIWLGDNPWRCDCRENGFLEFYLFLTEPPRRANDHKHLRCTSPEDFYGATWEAACRSVWYPQDIMGTTEKIWTYFMLAILAFFGFFCLYSSIKRFIDSRRKIAAENERQENIQEMREVARENQLRLRQEAQLNAPDVRESRPPCYEDAIQLPKLDAASFASLDELLLRGKRKKKRRHRQSTGEEGTDADDENDRAELRPNNRSRSENVLSVRAVVYQEPTDAVDRENSPIYDRPTSNRIVSANVPVTPSGQPNEPELHYHSTDILRTNRPSTSSPTSSRSITVSVHQPTSSAPSRSTDPIQDLNSRSYENSPYAKRKVKPLQHLNPNGSIEEITDFEGYESSPYAKRRIQHMASFKGDRDRPPLPARPPPSSVQQLLQDSDDEDEPAIKVVDDYFKPEQAIVDLDGYAVVTEEDVRRNLLDQGQRSERTRADANSSDSSSIEIIPSHSKKEPQ
ncbi:insulin-like growth factor-binding protein complex acid labile subunit [Ochlerotatus camptorhynchus]|uniref:insulin-like growth factor-binding protein complex acid labile subunit n=1 Tax=Ochlerotatus camptorhynchus TaxID=644619 RepID=UPI0031D941CB